MTTETDQVLRRITRLCRRLEPDGPGPRARAWGSYDVGARVLQEIQNIRREARRKKHD